MLPIENIANRVVNTLSLAYKIAKDLPQTLSQDHTPQWMEDKIT